MKKIVKADFNKANSLLLMAKTTFERLNSFDKLKYPSNTVNDYYDILHKLFEGYASIKGLKFSEENAHKELIDYICNQFFNDSDRIFLQNLRQFRNQISYEGFNVPKNFLKRNNIKIEEYIIILIKELEKSLK